jgi:hypothetical protein
VGVAHMVSSVAAVISIEELLDSSCFGHFLLLLLLPFIATSYQTYSSYRLLLLTASLLSLSLSPPLLSFSLQCRDCGKQVYLGKFFHSSCPCPYLEGFLCSPLLRMDDGYGFFMQADLTQLMRRLGIPLYDLPS